MNPLSEPRMKTENAGRSAQEELGCLMDAYGNDVLRTAYMFLKDRQKAEDAFQEVFLKVFRRMDEFRGESTKKTWLIRITINTCKDMLKSSWLKRVVLTDKATDKAVKCDPAGRIIREDENRLLYDAVLDLAPQYKEVVILFYYQEFDISEIGRTLKVAEGTVRSRLHRAREILRKKLEGRVEFNG